MNKFRITRFKIEYQIRGNVRLWLYGYAGHGRIEGAIPNLCPIDLTKEDAIMILQLLKSVEPLFVESNGVFSSEIEDTTSLD